MYMYMYIINGAHLAFGLPVNSASFSGLSLAKSALKRYTVMVTICSGGSSLYEEIDAVVFVQDDGPLRNARRMSETSCPGLNLYVGGN